MASWINWGLNIEPCLRPGLASMYEKMAGKQHPFKLLWISHRIIRDLTWLSRQFSDGNGIQLLHAIAWSPAEADATLYSDALGSGLGFWSPKYSCGFAFNLPLHLPSHAIFYAEAFIVTCALHWASTLPFYIRRLAIYTDNSNTVDMMNSMKAKAPYNALLKFAVDILIEHDIDLRVYHIPGELNTVADTLSRHNLTVLCASHPSITVFPYAPPPHLEKVLAT
jgi:Reverse transcriptase-like